MMNVAFAILLIVFATLLALNVPVAFVLGIATLLAAFALGYDHVLISFAADMGNGLDAFALLAIPFFILAGDLMGAGGLASRLIDLAALFLGRFRGGLAMVNALTCMLFGTISGSAAAAVSSVGGTLIPEMTRKGYDKDFNIALTASAATTGLLIPPSNVMIIYAVVASNVSIGALFLAGLIPGLLMGCFIMLAAVMVSRHKGYGGNTSLDKSSMDSRPWWQIVWRALPSLALVVFVLFGILGGWFTPTEASAVAVLWAFILAVVFYRNVQPRALPKLISGSARTTGIVMLLIAVSQVMSGLLTKEQIPQAVSDALLGLSDHPLMILLIINVILLAVGVFMDMTPAVLVFTPIFLPVAIGLGIDPVHFGIILIANLCIGLCTPPVGTCLFLGCSVGRSKIDRVSRAMIPFFIAMVAALVLITWLPCLSLWLPRLLKVMD
jgi:tripartite ATP-independent transporter DctM subunit